LLSKNREKLINNRIEIIQDISKLFDLIKFFKKENYFTKKDLEIFRRQSNILYYTSRISRKISSTIKYWTSELRNIIYFTSYILYIKYFLDINLNHIALLAIEFDIIFPKPLVFYEMKDDEWTRIEESEESDDE
jgi:hypothetical protein